MPNQTNSSSNASARITAFIARSAWFEGLPSSAIAVLACQSRLRNYKANDTLYLINDKADAVYGVLGGVVRVSVSSSNGQEFILNHLGPDAWLGEAALVGDRHRVQEARIKQDAEILILPAKTVLRLAEEFPLIYKNLFTKQLRRTRAVYDTLAGSLFYPLKARVAGRLLQIVRRHGKPCDQGIVADFRLSQNDFANMTMGSRQRVNKIFRDWEREGVLIKQGSSYIVTDLDALERAIELTE